MSKAGSVERVYGPVVSVSDMEEAKIYDIVHVGSMRLIGEVIRLRNDIATVQVYEDTSGIKPGDEVENTGQSLSVELGPGLIGSIYDGLQRPLKDILEQSGNFIKRGVHVRGLDGKRKWGFKPAVKKGDKVVYGSVLGTVLETETLVHRIMATAEGTVKSIEEGEFTVDDVIGRIEGRKNVEEARLHQRCMVRRPRPIAEKFSPEVPLNTGQRIIDTFFPIAKGGTVAIPGPFGSGKTVMQHSLAKYADTDIVVYVGCGERGNEMTEVLTEFPKLEDPKTKKPLMNRTILIANTSNMPVAAREASMYTGATIAEYYRDMGYDVALMVDSTSRWAEAMREISSRLEEMPGEEGYPAYLGRRLAEFYSRAGKVRCAGDGQRYGSVTIVGAVSPPGGDISEPVSQNTLRVTKVFHALDSSLAHRRHFPAINWLKSYSLYIDALDPALEKTVAQDYTALRREAMALLQKEAELQDIVKLVGPDTLPESEQEVLKTTAMLREDFMQQSAFDEVDAFTTYGKQYLMLKAIMTFHRKAAASIEAGIPLEDIMRLKVAQDIGRMKAIPNDRREDIKAMIDGIEGQFADIAAGEHD